jgi:arylsulfatase A-like enzyme
MHFSPDLQALRGFQTRERQEEFTDKIENDDYQRWLCENGFGDMCAPHGVRGEMYYVPQPSQLPPRFHPAQWVGERTTAFIKENGKKTEPWLLFSSFIHPHPPFTPPSPWHDLYPATMMPAPKLPPHHESFWTWINRHQNRYKYRDQGWDLNFLRCLKAYYYACISFVDYQVGRILAALEETGRLDDTLIIFASDHGEFLGDYGCFGKRNMLDPAARIPLLIRHPNRFAAGRVCRKPVNLVDVAPTVMAACGLQPRPDWDGSDLADIASGKIERQAIFSQFQKPEKAIYMALTEEWKYFYSAADDAAWLFDRRHDPEETHNLAGTGWAADAEKTMRQGVQNHLRQLGETGGLDGEKWKKMPPFKLPQNPDAGLGRRQQAWAKHDLPGYAF